MNANTHTFKFLGYEYKLIEGAACMPYWQIIAHLLCTLCGYYYREKVVLNDQTCIQPSWPKPDPLYS